MKKYILFTVFSLLSLSGCKDQGYNNGYGYNYNTSYPYNTTSSYYNTSLPVQSSYTTPYYYNQYSYPNYSYPSSYYYPSNYTYYYPAYNWNYLYPRVNQRYYRSAYGISYCQVKGVESKLNFSVESSLGSDKRNIVGENLRTQTFNKRTEVEYANKDESLKFVTNEKGDTSASGKILVDGQPVTIDSKTQKCTMDKSSYPDDSRYELAKFECTGDVALKAEVLIPDYDRDLPLVKSTELSKAPKLN